jgi:O-acetyl-ADP-ribose deacetylase
MRVRFGKSILELLQGDITTARVDAIANAANAALAGGGGVDGAIHLAAGPEVLQELRTRYPNGCPTGSAVATTAGRLAARFVLHAVGPIWQGGQKQEADLLRSAYRTCLELANQNCCRSLAFPSISTGVYRFPVDLAAGIAIDTMAEFLQLADDEWLIQFWLFDEGTWAAYAQAAERWVLSDPTATIE